jgi:hypothetical protein
LRREFTDAKREELLVAIETGDTPAGLRAQAEWHYYLASFQVNSAERGTRQIAVATFILALATIGLFVATVVLVTVTSKHGS